MERGALNFRSWLERGALFHEKLAGARIKTSECSKNERIRVTRHTHTHLGPRKSLDCTLLYGMGQLLLFMILCFISDAQLGESLIDEYFCKSNLLGY